MSDITIDSLIEQGNNILSGITYVPAQSGVWRTYSAYRLKDDEEYTVWKHKTIRFLTLSFPQDSYLPELNKQFDEFEKRHYNPSVFKQILGLIKAYKDIPETVIIQSENQKPLIEINNSLSQSQTQSISVIIDILKDELNGRQLKELKDIIDSNTNEETKRKSLFDKIKSFGSDVAANILANIITNPNIYGSLFC